MNFVLDENVPAELSTWLKRKGHSAIFCPKGIPDETVASHAKRRKAILLTQDRHFANSVRFPPQDFAEIIRIKIHPSYIEDITFALAELLKIFQKPEDFKGKLIVLERDGFFRVKE